jgi:CMP-N-acetylneuraminic acid synthetase
MKILGLIPARGGSKGVPKKNIKLLNDKPLIAYTIQSALESNQFTDLVVSTDDHEIAQVADQYGLKVPFIRPPELSTDTAKSIDVVLHALAHLENNGIIYDAVCLLQPTNPFRTVQLIKSCINLLQDKDFDAVVSVERVPAEYNPHWQFHQDSSGCLKIITGEKEIISRRQDLPITYKRDGSIYLTKVQIIKEFNSFYGDKLGFVEIPEGQINIDTMEDWNRAEEFIKNQHVRN